MTSRCRHVQRGVEPDFDEVDKTTLQERISGRMGIPTVVIEVPKISRQESVEVVRSVPQDPISERSQVINVPEIPCRENAEVVKSITLDRISERMGIIEVPEISCQRSVEAVRSIFQERSPERRCEQSEVIKVTETSSQDLDETGHESLSRFYERICEKRRKGETEENPSILKQFEEGGAEFVLAFPFVSGSRPSTGNSCFPLEPRASDSKPIKNKKQNMQH